MARKRPPAHKRGGLGVRKRMSEESRRNTYRLNGVRRGQLVARCNDKYGRWEGGYTVGVIVRLTSTNVYIRWQDSDENKMYSQGDARYEVDRGRWRITNAEHGNPLDPFAAALVQLPEDDTARGSLTSDAGKDRIGISPQNRDDETTEEMNDMAKELSNAAREREAAKKAVANGDLRDRDTYTAKQVAARCGTDSKTMRKFFRSSHSTVEAVGQGGRYEFDADDLPQIKREFNAWQNKSSRTPINTPAKKRLQEQFKRADGDHDRPTPKAERDPVGDEVVDEEYMEVDEEEPSEEDLEALEDEELENLDLDGL